MAHPLCVALVLIGSVFCAVSEAVNTLFSRAISWVKSPQHMAVASDNCSRSILKSGMQTEWQSA